MSNLDLFAPEAARPPVKLIRGWQPDHESLLEAFTADLPWEQREFGPTRTFRGIALCRNRMPRMECLLGPPGASYTYSGLTYEAIPMGDHHLMGFLALDVQRETGHAFNAAFCNLYRDGRDSIGWHRDDERSLGDPTKSVIASVSLGAPRRFAMRELGDTTNRHAWDLGRGDLLLMGAGCQSRWEHSAPKTQRAVGPRIVITFRQMEF